MADLGYNRAIDSRAWTGRSYGPAYARTMRWSASWYDRAAWWARIALKKLICPHEYSFGRDACELCHLTGEEAVDHTIWPIRLPHYVGVRARG